MIDDYGWRFERRPAGRNQLSLRPDAIIGGRQRVLKGLSPNQVVREHLEIRPRLANPRFHPPDPCTVTRSRIDALRVVEHAKEVSQPDI